MVWPLPESICCNAEGIAISASLGINTDVRVTWSASDTVRTFELVYCAGKTEMILSARTLDDMKRYASLFSQVYGELELGKADPSPVLLLDLHRLSSVCEHLLSAPLLCFYAHTRGSAAE